MLETPCLGFSLGAGHVGTLCLAHSKKLDSRKESRCSATDHIVCDKQFRYSQLPLPVVDFFPSKFRLPHTSQGPALDTGLSKNELSQACCINFFLHASDFLTPCRLQQCQSGVKDDSHSGSRRVSAYTWLCVAEWLLVSYQRKHKPVLQGLLFCVLRAFSVEPSAMQLALCCFIDTFLM